MSVDTAVEYILTFEERFGENQLLLACYAAFPLIITPELVNLIRINFLDSLNISWDADSDLLLSPFCYPIREGIYQIDPTAREILIEELIYRSPDGTQILYRLANFLSAYLDKPTYRSSQPEIARLQRWVAWSYLQPSWVVSDLLKVLNIVENAGEAYNIKGPLEVAVILEMLRVPLSVINTDTTYQLLEQRANLIVRYWYSEPAESPARERINSIFAKTNIAEEQIFSGQQGTSERRVASGEYYSPQIYIQQSFFFDPEEQPLPVDAPTVEQMVEWFLEHYEDPAESVPYESAEGGYQYFEGEPYDAEEELTDQFPLANEETIREAVETVEQHGGPEWVKKDRLPELVDDDETIALEELASHEHLLQELRLPRPEDNIETRDTTLIKQLKQVKPRLSALEALPLLGELADYFMRTLPTRVSKQIVYESGTLLNQLYSEDTIHPDVRETLGSVLSVASALIYAINEGRFNVPESQLLVKHLGQELSALVRQISVEEV